MTTQNNGGSAFPITESNGVINGWPGMTMRDYFAANALMGLITTRNPDYHGEDGFDVLTADAYSVADAMLKAREEK